MTPDVSIQLHDARWKTLLKPYGRTVREACAEALAGAGIPAACRFEMAVVLADDAFVRELNRTYRGYDKPTNVLSFPACANVKASVRRLKAADSFAIGDVVLALETLKREAREQGKTARHHAMHLLVHGTLHLLGYDHEKAGAAARMEEMEVKVLKKLKVGNPYL